MGNAGGSNNARAEIDKIAAHYILTHPDPQKFKETAYCNKIMFLTHDVLNFETYKTNSSAETCDKSVSETKAKLYVRVANLFASIIDILNPVYQDTETKKFKKIDFKKMFVSNDSSKIDFYNLFNVRIDSMISYYCNQRKQSKGNDTEKRIGGTPQNDTGLPNSTNIPSDKFKKILDDIKSSVSTENPEQQPTDVQAFDHREFIITEHAMITDPSKNACVISPKHKGKVDDIKAHIKKKEPELVKILYELFETSDGKSLNSIKNVKPDKPDDIYINSKIESTINSLIKDFLKIINDMDSEFDELKKRIMEIIEASLSENTANNHFFELENLEAKLNNPDNPDNPDNPGNPGNTENNVNMVNGLNNIIAGIITNNENSKNDKPV